MNYKNMKAYIKIFLRIYIQILSFDISTSYSKTRFDIKKLSHFVQKIGFVINDSKEYRKCEMK